MRRCADSESHLIVIRACVLGKVPHVQSDACSPSAERATEPPGRWGQLLFCHVSALQTRLFTPLPARAARSRGCWGRPGETGDAGRCAGRSVNGRRCGPSATDTRNERAPGRVEGAPSPAVHTGLDPPSGSCLRFRGLPNSRLGSDARFRQALRPGRVCHAWRHCSGARGRSGVGEGPGGAPPPRAPCGPRWADQPLCLHAG